MKRLIALIYAVLVVSCATAHAQRPIIGPFSIQSIDSAQSPFTIQAAPGQTAPLFRVQTTGGTAQTIVDQSGVVIAKLSVAGVSQARDALFTGADGLVYGANALTFDPATKQLQVFGGQDASQANLDVFSKITSHGPIGITNSGYSSLTIGNTAIDLTTWNRSTTRIAAQLSDAKSYESALVIHALNNAPVIKNGCNGGTVDCSWTALHETEAVTIYAQDGGTYWSGIPGGPVGIDVRAGVLATGHYANAFAGYYEGDLAPGAAGANNGITTMEIGVNDYNNNNDEPEVGQWDTKMALQLVDNEGANPTNSPSTAAILINRQVTTGGGFHKGLLAYQTMFPGITKNDGFLYLGKSNAPGIGGVSTPLFWVRPNGNTMVGDFENFTNTGTYASASFGQLAVRQQMVLVNDDGTNVSLTNNKNLLVFLEDNANAKSRIISGVYDTHVNPFGLTLETGIAGSTSVNEVLYLTTNPFVQFTASYAGATRSAAGTFALRNNAGTAEISQNAGAWLPIGGSGSSLWTYAADPQGGGRFDLYPSTDVVNDRVLVGFGASDITDQGVLIGKNCLYAISSEVAATVGSLCYIAGGPTITLTSGKTGGAYVPLTFGVNGGERARMPVAGNFLVGMTSTDDPDTTDIVTPGCLVAASATASASIGTLCYVSGETAVDLSSGITPGGVYVPINIKTNNVNMATFNVNGRMDVAQSTDTVTGFATAFTNIGRFSARYKTANAASFNTGTQFYIEQTAASLFGAEAQEWYAVASHAAGNVATMIGTTGSFEHAGAGTVTTAYGVASHILIHSTGGGTDAAGFYSKMTGRAGGGSGTFTNGYGLKVDTFGSGFTNKWGVYVADTSAGNYFGGTLNVGTTASFGTFTSFGSSVVAGAFDTSNPSVEITFYSSSGTPRGYLFGSSLQTALVSSTTGGALSLLPNAVCGTTGSCVDLTTGGGGTFLVDDTNSATLTNIYLDHNGSQKQVAVGAADSCGTGYRCLRITN